MKEVAHTRIVAVAVHQFVLEVLFVVLQLFLDVRKLSVKLVLLRVLRGMKTSILCFFRHSSFFRLSKHGALDALPYLG